LLQAEKQLVKNISKLKSQREKIREFQGAQEGLAQLEAEAKKLKAVIDEVRWPTARSCIRLRAQRDFKGRCRATHARCRKP
jgi:hypothetical protein